MPWIDYFLHLAFAAPVAWLVIYIAGRAAVKHGYLAALADPQKLRAEENARKQRLARQAEGED
ncbi:hypothetical protein [Microbacterium marinilacus]|uniref:Uncharacterized protein n=1 Tax=Microbacterium marinilacus TaxID=415209 RepID=A0ABP7BG80_9MICO|nr:hypothetical protein [Microbacterium marinilacus]MBY0690510.1 hypothetical protein [Microbacterium marinilacus]